MGAFATFVAFAWRDHSEYELSASELKRIDGQRRAARMALVEGRETGITPVKYKKPTVHGSNQIGDPDAGFKGPAPKRIITGYGFWVFLLSDFILFAGFYAAYAVLSKATAGGPAPRDLFDLKTVAIETACLLLSSFACGMATLASNARSMRWTQIGYLVTGALGVAFPGPRDERVCAHDCAGRGPRPQRVLCRLSLPWSDCTACTSPSDFCGSGP